MAAKKNNKSKTFTITSATKSVTIRFNRVARKGAVKRGKKFLIPREAVQVVISMPRKKAKKSTPKRRIVEKATISNAPKKNTSLPLQRTMIKRLIVLLGCFVVLAGCRVRYVEVPVITEKVKIEYRTNSRHDSVYLADTVHTYTQGDAIYRDKTRYKVKYVSVIDTIHTADTLYRYKEVRVSNTSRAGRSLMDWLGLISTVVLFFILMFWIWRKLKSPLR